MQILERHPVTTAPIEVEFTEEEMGLVGMFQYFLEQGAEASTALIRLHDETRRIAPDLHQRVMTPQFCDWLLP